MKERIFDWLSNALLLAVFIIFACIMDVLMATPGFILAFVLLTLSGFFSSGHVVFVISVFFGFISAEFFWWMVRRYVRKHRGTFKGRLAFLNSLPHLYDEDKK